MKPNNAKITISRPSRGDGREVITVSVKDANSRMRFLDLTLNLDDFAKAITGHAEIECEMEVKGLDKVGKVRVVEPRSKECPLPSYSGRGILGQWLKENGQEEGWTIDHYLGSQNSIGTLTDSDGCILNYYVFKYVEAVDGQ